METPATKSTMLALNVITDDPARVAKVADILVRVATGLILDGVSVNVSFTEFDNDPAFDQDNDIAIGGTE